MRRYQTDNSFLHSLVWMYCLGYVWMQGNERVDIKSANSWNTHNGQCHICSDFSDGLVFFMCLWSLSLALAEEGLPQKRSVCLMYSHYVKLTYISYFLTNSWDIMNTAYECRLVEDINTDETIWPRMLDLELSVVQIRRDICGDEFNRFTTRRLIK